MWNHNHHTTRPTLPAVSQVTMQANLALAHAASSRCVTASRRTSVRSADVEVASVSPWIAAEDKMRLGKSDITVPVIGVGAWAWGDRSGYW